MPDDSSVAFSVKQRMYATEIAILILDCNAENPRMQAKFYSYKNDRTVGIETKPLHVKR